MVAERETGGDLVIYLVSTAPIPTDVIGDGGHRPRFDAKAQQLVNEEWRRRNAPVKRVRATGRR